MDFSMPSPRAMEKMTTLDQDSKEAGEVPSTRMKERAIATLAQVRSTSSGG